MRPDARRRVAFSLVLGLVLGIAGAASAAFSWTTTNDANRFVTDTDWTPPSGASVIAAASSTTPGVITQGGDYHVYANATDAGNPAAGVATVTADVTNVTAGLTSVALSTAGGPWTIGGTSYAYRSTQLTADDPLSEGSKDYTLTMTDAHTPANADMQTFSVTVDNSGPSAVDIQIVNGIGTAAKPDAGDVITFTYSEPMAPTSILAGWAGTPTTVTVTLQNNGCGTSDTLTVGGANLGTVCLGRGDYMNGIRTFTTSTMVMVGSTVVVTLGGSPITLTAGGTGTLSWTPSTAATDLIGNACLPGAATEQGALDVDF